MISNLGADPFDIESINACDVAMSIFWLSLLQTPVISVGEDDMTDKSTIEEKRKIDPYLDRRNVDDRRQTYDLDYFIEGGRERRNANERRTPEERRENCVRVSKWTSVCSDDATRPS